MCVVCRFVFILEGDESGYILILFVGLRFRIDCLSFVNCELVFRAMEAVTPWTAPSDWSLQRIRSMPIIWKWISVHDLWMDPGEMLAIAEVLPPHSEVAFIWGEIFVYQLFSESGNKNCYTIGSCESCSSIFVEVFVARFWRKGFPPNLCGH